MVPASRFVRRSPFLRALRKGWLVGRACVALGWTANLLAQGGASPSPVPASPVPASTPNPAATPTPPVNAAGTPAAAAANPAPGGTGQADIIDKLSQGELQEAINLLRANYIRPADLDDRALARATLAGVLEHLDQGAMLLPKPGAPTAGTAAEPLPDGFQSEMFGDHTGYVRLGALTKDHLGALDRALKGFTDRGVTALILDLRASGPSSDYELAAEVIRRFVAKGKPLFTLRKPSNNQDRLFTSNNDPAFNGLVLLATDGDTAGAAETVAAVIRYYDRALVVGVNTAGQAVEYADLRLSGGNLLRVAVSQVVLPANLSIFPGGVKPDVPVNMGHADLIKIFRQSLEKDRNMGQFVFETERPHFNEAALVSGVNPEFDAARDAQAARRRGEPAPTPALRDAVVQRALDLATAIPASEAKPGAR